MITPRPAPTRVAACLLGIALLFAAPPARAQRSAAKLAAEAERLVQEGMRALIAEAYSDAFARFDRAHDLRPDARTRYGLGIVSHQQHEFARAVELLRGALAAPRGLSAEQRRLARRTLRAAEAEVGQYMLSVEPAGARLWLDGARLERSADGWIVLPPGTYRLAATSRRCGGHELKLRVVGGERMRIPLSLCGSAAHGATSGGAFAADGSPAAAPRHSLRDGTDLVASLPDTLPGATPPADRTTRVSTGQQAARALGPKPTGSLGSKASAAPEVLSDGPADTPATVPDAEPAPAAPPAVADLSLPAEGVAEAPPPVVLRLDAPQAGPGSDAPNDRDGDSLWSSPWVWVAGVSAVALVGAGTWWLTADHGPDHEGGSLGMTVLTLDGP